MSASEHREEEGEEIDAETARRLACIAAADDDIFALMRAAELSENELHTVLAELKEYDSSVFEQQTLLTALRARYAFSRLETDVRRWAQEQRRQLEQILAAVEGRGLSNVSTSTISPGVQVVVKAKPEEFRELKHFILQFKPEQSGHEEKGQGPEELSESESWEFKFP